MAKQIGNSPFLYDDNGAKVIGAQNPDGSTSGVIVPVDTIADIPDDPGTYKVGSQLFVVGDDGKRRELNKISAPISSGKVLWDFSTLTGYSATNGATIELVDVDAMPEIGKPGATAIKFTVPAGSGNSELNFPALASALLCQNQTFVLVCEVLNRANGDGVLPSNTFYLGADSGYSANYYNGTQFTRYGLQSIYYCPNSVVKYLDFTTPGAVKVGDTITGATSGATAKVIGFSGDSFIIKDETGTWQAENTTTKGAAISGAAYDSTFQSGSRLTVTGAMTADSVRYGKLRITKDATYPTEVIVHAVLSAPASPPIVTIIVDDGYASVINEISRYLDKYNLKAGFSIIESLEYLSESDKSSLYYGGHDLIPHGLSNLNTFATVADAIADINKNIEYLNARGFSRATNLYVYPQGNPYQSTNYPMQIINYLDSVGCKIAWTSIGNLDVAVGGINKYFMRRYNCAVNVNGATASDRLKTLRQALDHAEITGKSICLMFHDILASGATGDHTNRAEFQSYIDEVALRVKAGRLIYKRPSDVPEALGV